jgi:hypothetical protein
MSAFLQDFFVGDMKKQSVHALLFVLPLRTASSLSTPTRRSPPIDVRAIGTTATRRRREEGRVLLLLVIDSALDRRRRVVASRGGAATTGGWGTSARIRTSTAAAMEGGGVKILGICGGIGSGKSTAISIVAFV